MTTAADSVDPRDGASSMPAPERTWLRRSGARPLAFDGWLLLEASSWDPDMPWWHEVRIYETVDGRFAVAIGALFKAADRADFWRSTLVDGAEAAVELLERFDPAVDVPVEVDLRDPELCAPALEALGQETGKRIEQIRTAYRRMLATMLPT